MAPRVKRSQLMAFKVTPLEARYIDYLADEAGMMRSGWIRRVLRSHIVQQIAQKEKETGGPRGSGLRGVQPHSEANTKSAS